MKLWTRKKYDKMWTDSKFEQRLAEGVLKDLPYHSETIKYTHEKTYTPDWTIPGLDGKVIYIEAKGRFRTSDEAAKYLWIRKALLDHEELVFLFMNPKTPMPNAKKRKCGTKRTVVEWAVKNNFRWFTEETIKEVL